MKILEILKLPSLRYVLIEFGAISDAAFVDKATFKERVFSIAAGLIFVVSDLTLAIDKFVNPIQNAKFFILSTYFLAQYCFVQWAICKAERTGAIKNK